MLPEAYLDAPGSLDYCAFVPFPSPRGQSRRSVFDGENAAAAVPNRRGLGYLVEGF